jgi:hypothetical protein
MTRPSASIARAVACLAAMLAAGCQVRDEPVKSPDGQAFWPRTARAPAGDTTGREAAEVAYVDDYEAASRRARAEGRPLLLVFRASWCRWSGELARGPLAEPRLVALTRRCVCTQVDADRDAATCRAFAVAAFPTVIVVAADGRECFRGTGAAVTVGLAAALDAVPPAGTAEDRLAAEERQAGAAKDVTR